ncbi:MULTISPECIES: hypothetical protein [unclassified Crossiella]|uniref:hypothetical protein n=1 Tax=unclassified Crossiella TaxID=2620835 RepID=UPI001FFFB4BE|nr:MULTISPECIES: hypothetical protein [unclassified Crossiella]MCK2241874.1 hypothetical protein [Crossiella sp. S99.2]MCK2255777.1 hypothetical protein [Crossiella sp. S99.1]
MGNRIDWQGIYRTTRQLHPEWSTAVLAALHGGPLRYMVLRRTIQNGDLAQGKILHDSVLNKTLQILLDDQLIWREDMSIGAQSIVCYGLTKKADNLVQRLNSAVVHPPGQAVR